MREQIWQRAMLFFSHSCHQKSERSFFYHGYQFPVCARCTGLYMGDLFGLLLWLFLIRLTIPTCFFLLVPAGIDGGIQLVCDYESTNRRRLFSDILAGIGCIQLFIHFLYWLL